MEGLYQKFALEGAAPLAPGGGEAGAQIAGQSRLNESTDVRLNALR